MDHAAHLQTGKGEELRAYVGLIMDHAAQLQTVLILEMS